MYILLEWALQARAASVPVHLDLDASPALSWSENAGIGIAGAAGTAVAARIVLALQPVVPAWMQLFGSLAVGACSALLARAYLLERRFKALEVDPPVAAYANSRFLDVEGARVHYEFAEPSASSGADPLALAAHCYHGFGANTASWMLCLQVRQMRP